MGIYFLTYAIVAQMLKTEQISGQKEKEPLEGYRSGV